jgi:S-adenosylmethionine hydrolase
MSPIITLTTDFGLTDAYVAAMKGVILGINPEATVVDICHTIDPQDIAQAAFVLGTAYQAFPRGTVHLVVVDPGVGSQRRAVILRTPSADFVAPDNGVLSYIIKQLSPELTEDNQLRELGPEIEAYAITEPRYWRTPVSPTFHGRDIFAPVAAHLSLGRSPADFGERLTSLVILSLTRPHQEPDGSVVGHILHIDNFGSLITDITTQYLPSKSEPLSIKVGGQTIHGLSRTYTEGEGLLALVGSSDRLEISVKGGSAHDLLKAEVGDEVRLRPQG